jgi:hypothetical protein
VPEPLDLEPTRGGSLRRLLGSAQVRLASEADLRAVAPIALVRLECPVAHGFDSVDALPVRVAALLDRERGRLDPEPARAVVTWSQPKPPG